MDMTAQFNYYDVLEVNPHCPQHEITTAYEKAKNTYSGENPAIYTMFSEDEARDLLKMVEEAYSVLGNKTLRALYDEKIGQKKPIQEISFEALQAESKLQFSNTIGKTKIELDKYEKDESLEKEFKQLQSWTGESLKKVREYKRISLDKMSEVSKISSFYINAIETEDYKNLPAPVFVRGYVVQIAKILALDEKTVADSYMKVFKSKIEK